MIRSIFISRNSTELPLLAEFCEQHAINLLDHSLISFESVLTKYTNTPDVLFFSSIRSAEFYLAQNQISPHTAIATIGYKTAEKLKELGLKINFIGSTAGDPESVAKEFSSWLNGRKVLIPCSDRSNRSIASFLPEDQVEEIVIYRTGFTPVEISLCDMYVFSSPSNVESFLILNKLPENALVVAWGKTTEKTLNKHGIKPTLVLSTSTEEEIVNFLKTKK